MIMGIIFAEPPCVCLAALEMCTEAEEEEK